MKFLDLAKLGRTSVGLYLGGVALLIILYILGNLYLLLDLKFNFPELVFDPENPAFIASYGTLRLLIGVLIPFVLMFAGLLVYLRFAHRRPFLNIFTSATHFRWKRFFSFGAVLVVLFFLFAFAEVTLLGQTKQLTWNFNAERFFPLLLVALFMVPLQAAAEELVFRVYAMQGLYLRTKSALASILISALLFALMHISNPEISAMGYGLLLYYLMAGIFLALITVQDDGLELALAFHIFNNLFGVLVVSSSWQVFHTEALFLDQRPPGSLLLHLGSGLFIFTGLYFVLAKKFNWKPLRTLR
jgi:membrane protease YdiL (CAAX protease family)